MINFYRNMSSETIEPKRRAKYNHSFQVGRYQLKKQEYCV